MIKADYRTYINLNTNAAKNAIKHSTQLRDY